MQWIRGTNRKTILTAIILLIVLVDIALLRFVQGGSGFPLLPLAVALDFCLVIPVLYGLQSDRRSVSRWIPLLPLVLAGYLLSKMLLDANGQPEAKLLGYFIVPLELCFVLYSVFRIGLGVRDFRLKRQAQTPFYDSLKQSLEHLFPGRSGTGYLIHELSMYYYAFFAWKVKPPHVQPEVPAFTYHKNSNMLMLLIFLGFVLTVEGLGVHLLLSQWSELAAWILSAGNLYIMILFLADYRAMVLNPILLKDGYLRVRYGLRAFMDIPLDHITSVAAASTTIEVPKSEKKTAIAPAVDSPNVCLTCIEPVDAVFMFGIKRSSKNIYLAVDEPARFQKIVQEASMRLGEEDGS